MYQLGLLGVLRNRQVAAVAGLMRRALIRLRAGQRQTSDTFGGWQTLTIAMVRQNMEMIESRKMLLSRIDRVIRQVQKVAQQPTPPRRRVDW